MYSDHVILRAFFMITGHHKTVIAFAISPLLIWENEIKSLHFFLKSKFEIKMLPFRASIGKKWQLVKIPKKMFSDLE